MSAGRQTGPPVGVRPVGEARLRWVDPGPLVLALGDRVVVREGDVEWLGVVRVPPDRVVEWPEAGGLPRVSRRATADDPWPAPPDTAGRRLLDALALPTEALATARRRSAQAPVAPVLGPGDGKAGQDERADQERGGGQPERE